MAAVQTPTADQAKAYVRETLARDISDNSAVLILRAAPHPECEGVMSVFFNITGEDAAISSHPGQFDVWFEPLKDGAIYGEW